MKPQFPKGWILDPFWKTIAWFLQTRQARNESQMVLWLEAGMKELMTTGNTFCKSHGQHNAFRCHFPNNFLGSRPAAAPRRHYQSRSASTRTSRVLGHAWTLLSRLRVRGPATTDKHLRDRQMISPDRVWANPPQTSRVLGKSRRV